MKIEKINKKQTRPINRRIVVQMTYDFKQKKYVLGISHYRLGFHLEY